MPSVFPRAASNGNPDLANTRATQHGGQNINLATREQRPPQQLWNQSTNGSTIANNALPNPGWVSASPGALPNSGLDNSGFDTCMSDNTSEGHRSSGQTPSTTNFPSSNTSYSPPQDDDLDMTLRTASHHPTPNSNTATTPVFLSYSPSKDTSYPSSTSPSQAQVQDDGVFTIPHGWQLGTEHDLPDGLSGLSPSGDSGWTQMLDVALWDGASLGMDNSGSWTTQQGHAS